MNDIHTERNNKLTAQTASKNKIPISQDFKILSIDGGGIKGLYAAKQLAAIEEKIGGSIGEYFDMICGASTGGLIALGITSGIPCKQIARFYQEYGPLIFPYDSKYKRRFRKITQAIASTKYDNKKLKSALKTLLTDYKTMKEAKNYMCIPSFNLTTGQPKVFKKPFNQYHVDGRILMMDVALATSAAPTYLPAVEIEDCLYVDGGIYNNNPSLIGYTEAMDHFWGREIEVGDQLLRCDKISVLSIGLPKKPIGELPTISKDRSLMDWGLKLIHTPMEGVNFVSAYQTKKLVEAVGGYYHRIEPITLSPEQLRILEMDNTSPESLKSLIAYGQTIGDHYTASNWPSIEYFFKSPKSYKTKSHGKNT